MIGVVDRGKGVHKNFRTRAVGLLGETRTNIELGNKAVIRVCFLFGVSHETLRGWSRATDAQVFPSLSVWKALRRTQTVT